MDNINNNQIFDADFDSQSQTVKRFKGTTGENYKAILGFVPVSKEELSSPLCADKIERGIWKELTKSDGSKMVVKVPLKRAFLHFYEKMLPGGSRPYKYQFYCNKQECCRILGSPAVYWGLPIGVVKSSDYSEIDWYFWRLADRKWETLQNRFKNTSPVVTTLLIGCEDQVYQKFDIQVELKGGSVVWGVKPDQYDSIIKNSTRIMDNPNFTDRDYTPQQILDILSNPDSDTLSGKDSFAVTNDLEISLDDIGI